MQDRRGHVRQDADSYMIVRERETERHIGELANLSPRGAMFITSDKVRQGATLKCFIRLAKPILDRKEIEFDAECRWSRRNVRRDRWESGYQLYVAGINEELLSYLSLSFALDHWKNPDSEFADTITLENRRRATRYEAKIDISVFEKRRYREIGKLLDLSHDGARLRTSEPITPGSIVPCKLQLPKTIFQRDFIFFDAECVWCRQVGDPDTYESGYRLQNIAEHDAVIILHLMIHYLEEKSTEKRIQVVK